MDLFLAGNYDGRDYTADDIAEIAQSYDPKLHQAPMVIGHPETDAPAYGWVHAVTGVDGRLATPNYEIVPEFADQIKKGLYRKRSIALYDRHDPHNPTPGKLYLKHVGWLGATPPKVKGLGDVQFAQEPNALTITVPLVFAEGLPPEKPEKEKPEKPAELPDLATLIKGIMDAGYSIEDLVAAVEDMQATTKEETEEPPEFAERTRTLEARERALSKREAEMQRKDLLKFCEGLGGRLTARQIPDVVEFLVGLPATTLQFSEGKKTTQAWFKDFLRGLKPQIVFGELAASADQPLLFAQDPKAVEAAIAAKTAELKAQGITKTYPEIIDLVFAEVK